MDKNYYSFGNSIFCPIDLLENLHKQKTNFFPPTVPWVFARSQKEDALSFSLHEKFISWKNSPGQWYSALIFIQVFFAAGSGFFRKTGFFTFLLKVRNLWRKIFALQLKKVFFGFHCFSAHSENLFTTPKHPKRPHPGCSSILARFTFSKSDWFSLILGTYLGKFFFVLTTGKYPQKVPREDRMKPDEFPFPKRQKNRNLFLFTKSVFSQK